jgi:hypothetical protein
LRRLLVPILMVTLALASCVDDQVPLSYSLDTGRRLEYLLHLEADITRTLAGASRDQRVRATFRATQQVLRPLPEGGVEASMSLVPNSLFVDGRSVEVGADQEFTVILGRDGRVVEIQQSAGDPSEPLEPVGIERLLPRLRPVLPGTPVGAGDAWVSATRFSDQEGMFSVSSRSRLLQLGVVDGYESALVRTTYTSPVDRRETFANAVADLNGTDVGAQEAWFALEGFLVRASGDSVGSYRVTFTPPGGDIDLQPVEGALVVRLHTEMKLLSEGPSGDQA